MGDTINAIILGLVQGTTEFLPISSSGHLILMREALRETAQNALAYDAVLQLATGLAIVVYFFPDLWRLFTVFLHMVGGVATEAKDKALVIAVMAGTIPALILGIFLEDLMETAFRSPLLVAFVLVAGSCLLAYAEFHSGMRTVENTHEHDISISLKRGVLIGCFQALALIPGMSRSGATIAGGLILGLTRYEATRFSFLLAVPIILGSGGKKLLELVANESLVALTPMLIGAGTAFVVGLIAIHFMLIFVRTHSLWPFIWYRIALALVVVFSVLNA
jgi:undecaprenyl-diphosphatase